VEKEQLIRYKINSDLNVCIDANVVDTVIRNLLTNAVKFTPKGGIITIEAGLKHKKNLQIAVTDTGIGIPSDIIPELFTVNEKKGRPGTNREKSSGLGLMICKEFVELLGGTIWVESTEFKGSTFYIEIPSA
jgi:signal transduction histidine kinase